MLLTFLHIIPSLFSAPDDLSVSDDMIPGTVKSITVSGVCGQGDYDFSNAPWPPTSLANPSTYVITPKDPSVKAGESKALTDKNSALMMIPQDFGPNAKVSMKFNDGAKDKTVSFSLKGSWEVGKHITYMLSSSKITTLNMGSLTYPTGWNSVNTGANAKNQIRTKYDPNTSAGLFVVNEKNKVIEANVQLTYDGTSWSLKGSKLKFSPQYNYFVYYPYQLGGLPGAPAKDASNIDVISAEKFFAKAIDYWKSHKITADQSTPDKMNACDLQIGKASLDEDGCSVSFDMEHAMGLAVLNRESKSLDHFYKLNGYEDYTWSNGSVPTTANGIISSGQKLFSTTATQGIMVVAPNSTVTFTNTSTDKDEWKTKSVPITINEGNKVYSGEAKLKQQHYDETTYKMEVGDIYYDNGGITKPSKDEIAAARKNGLKTIGIIGYLGNDYWTEKDVVIDEKPVGGHALVMCLKTIGSTGKTSMGTPYAWYSSDSDVGRTKVNSRSLLVNSYKQSYGSGYTETNALIKIWGPDPAPGAAYQAQNYKTLPAKSSKCTGWFLPSAGQYYAVMTTLGAPFSDDWDDWPEIWDGYKPSNLEYGFFNNMTTVSGNINAALSKVGLDQYTEFFQGTNTWELTSSEFSPTSAVLIDSGVDERRGSGSVRFASTIAKKRRISVRPFLAF